MSVTKDMSIIKDIIIALEFKAVDYYKISGKWPFWYDDAMAWLREQYEQTSPVLSNSCKTGKKWTEEDERHENTIIRAIHGAGNITPIDGELAEKWLKSLKQRIVQ